MQLQQSPLLTDTNLQGYWKLLADSNDSTSHALNGTDMAMTYSTTLPKFGSNADFNGSSSRINIVGSSGLNVANAALSINFWIYLRSTVGSYVVNKQHSAGNISPHFGNVYNVRVGDTTISCALSTAGASNQDDSSTTLPSVLNAWHMVTITYDGTTKRFYLDGAAQGTATQSGAIISDTGDLILGARTVGTTANTDMKLNDVAIFNRVLTPDEITVLHRDGFSGGMI